jgi:site-specific recombinase
VSPERRAQVGEHYETRKLLDEQAKAQQMAAGCGLAVLVLLALGLAFLVGGP